MGLFVDKLRGCGFVWQTRLKEMQDEVELLRAAHEEEARRRRAEAEVGIGLGCLGAWRHGGPRHLSRGDV